MNNLPTPQQIEQSAADEGLTMREVCSLSGMARSTFQRWKSGKTSPTVTTINRMMDAIHSKRAAKEPAHA
ncbi:helix-turn-helix domain-containing protein [Gluconobacter cerinus]|uniref:helix-turn-helix domain-containing protein n=1 Tax=Gluconobacter cerinus TaxID=38307 RepID=UPI0038D0622C